MGKEVQKINAERQRQRYSKEFKLNAIKLLQAGSKPATQIALELGVRRNLLYKWAEELNRHGGNTETAAKKWGQTRFNRPIAAPPTTTSAAGSASTTRTPD